VAALAARRHNVLTTAELAALGWDRHAVARRVRSGVLHRQGRGVYSFGTPSLTRDGWWLAAVLSCAPAVLSHRSAGALWGIWPNQRARVEVTTTARSGRRARPGVDLHRTRRLEPSETTEVDGIPVTTPARTLVDLADVLTQTQLDRAIAEADYLRLHAPIAAIPGRRGSGRLERRQALGRTRSDLELAFLDLVRDAHLPRPEVNVHVEGKERDFVWRAERLIVEVDGAQAHTTRRAFEEDRRRDVVLTLSGWRVLRFTYHQVTTERRYVKESLTRARISRA
jgi:very-short-patch-repair endonuclease